MDLEQTHFSKLFSGAMHKWYLKLLFAEVERLAKSIFSKDRNVK